MSKTLRTFLIVTLFARTFLIRILIDRTFLVRTFLVAPIAFYLLQFALSLSWTGFWKRYHIFWTRRLRVRPIPEEIFTGGLDWKFFSRLDPEKNSFEVNLLRNCCGEEVSEEVSSSFELWLLSGRMLDCCYEAPELISHPNVSIFLRLKST